MSSPRRTPVPGRPVLRRLVVLVAVVLVQALTLTACHAAGADLGAVELGVAPVPLDPTSPSRTRVDRLEFRGGLVLSGSGLGGLSGLEIDAAGRLIAISDTGTWLTARLEHDAEGRLTGLSGARRGVLVGPDGEAQLGKRLGDAESLTLLGDERLAVGFEQTHRLWRYPALDLSGRPSAEALPDGLASAPLNGGLEALAELADGRLLLLTEELPASPDSVRGWVGEPGRWEPLELVVHGELRPTSADRLPTGDVVVLTRGYSAATGSVVRIGKLAAAAIEAGARLELEQLALLRRPLTVDNFEGVASRLGPHGESLIYLVSDDNFSAAQRTLLLQFALLPAAE